jgi:glycosyltransferase involved in cell wall biosynthesis
MRALCLLTKSPVPTDSGSQQRLLHLLRALERIGSVDLVLDHPLSVEDRGALQAAFPTSRLWISDAPAVRHPASRMRWLRAWSLPMELATLDPTGVRADVASFAAASPEPYDVVWSFGLTESWTFSTVLPDLPLVDDLADITWVQADRALALARRAPDRHTLGGVKRRSRFRLARSRWARFERAEAARASLVTVCSEADRAQLALPGVAVLPNGYVRPAQPAGRSEIGDPPVVLFAGLMTYEPNVDGAAWFVDEILPLVQAAVPGVQFAIVGRAAPAVVELGSRAGVEVTGYVDRIEDALARADVVVVPLRQGSGTRIKIIEAWAHRIPVVSTRIGAEGLDATDGLDLLLADTPADFADAVARLLTDSELRRSLVEHGLDRFDTTFDWDRIEEHFADDVVALVDGRGRIDRSPGPPSSWSREH